MSSFIQWPTIYGSVYFLPGIIVVVLLLLLLLLMSSRRRAKAERRRLAPEPALAFAGPAVEEEPMAPASEAAAYPDYAPSGMAQPVATAMDQGGVVTQPVGFYSQPLAQQPMMGQQPMMAAQPAVPPSLTLVPPPVPAAAPAAMAVPAMMAAPVMAAAVTMAPAPAALEFDDPLEADSMLEPVKSGRRGKSKAARSTAPLSVVGPVSAPAGTDPLNVAIQEILNGWGELSPEDMKRLELFRPDRLNAALMGVQLTKSHSADAKVRLTQMRQYGIGLERRAQAMRTVEAATAATAAATVDVTSAPAAPMPNGASPAGSPGRPAFFDEPPIEQRSPIFTGYASPEEPPTTDSIAAAQAPAPVAQEAPAPATRSFYDAEPEIKQAAPMADPDALWAEPRPLWEPDPEPAFEEMPEPVFDEIEMEPVVNRGVHLDTSALAAALNTPMGMPVRDIPATAADPLEEAFTAAPAQPAAPAFAKAPFDDDLFWDDEPEAMSRLSVKVETAEQLMALPPTERADMTAFLPPTELAATFRATHDMELKRAVIDTLEHIGTPASLNALGNCFEDADPDIQVYALAAADRLLGVAS
jgi:hypothetical protein